MIIQHGKYMKKQNCILFLFFLELYTFYVNSISVTILKCFNKSHYSKFYCFYHSSYFLVCQFMVEGRSGVLLWRQP